MKYILPQDLRSFGLIPEIIGRLPVLTHLKPLDRTALRNILTEPKNSIVKQYTQLVGMDDVELVFEQGALEAIADKTLEKKTGARGLRSIMEQTLIPIMFKVPSEPTISKVIITADCVKNGTAPDVERDESRTERKLTTTLDFSVDHPKK